MEKKTLKKQNYQFLMNECQYLKEQHILSEEDVQTIESHYEIKESVSFTKVLLYFGSILIGIGVLTFIASNWSEIGKTVKFLLIMGLYASCIAAGYKLTKAYPKTARSFYYLSLFVFGAGIFLIGQMFHFGGQFQQAFLWWSLGIIPLSFALKDKWILFLSSVFLFVYLSHEPILTGEVIPYGAIFCILAVCVLNHKIGYSRLTAFSISVTALLLMGNILMFFMGHDEETWITYLFIYLAIGTGLVFFPYKRHSSVYVFLGHLVHGLSALFLTFEEPWSLDDANVIFAILYLIFNLYLIKKGSLVSIVILCVMIFRFYLDIGFNFLPKSLVFIIGGLILLTFGFFFEKQRKKGGDSVE